MTKKANDEPLSYFEIMKRNLDQIEANIAQINQGNVEALERIQALFDEWAKNNSGDTSGDDSNSASDSAG